MSAESAVEGLREDAAKRYPLDWAVLREAFCSTRVPLPRIIIIFDNRKPVEEEPTFRFESYCRGFLSGSTPVVFKLLRKRDYESGEQFFVFSICRIELCLHFELTYLIGP